jgi:DNA-binding response OmpR family regulator
MDIACMTEDPELCSRVAAALASMSSRFTAYRSMASLARGLDQQSHDVVLLATESDHLESFVSCCLRPHAGTGPLVILLSPQDCGVGLEQALLAGADDYVCTSSGLSQLGTRIRAGASRRPERKAAETLVVGPLRLERRDCGAYIDGQPVHLTQREFLLAWLLCSNQGHVVTVRAIAEAVWRSSAEISKRTIEQHVYRLRAKLKLGRDGALNLSMVYGRGYRLDAVRATEQGPAASQRRLLDNTDPGAPRAAAARGAWQLHRPQPDQLLER